MSSLLVSLWGLIDKLAYATALYTLNLTKSYRFAICIWIVPCLVIALPLIAASIMKYFYFKDVRAPWG